MTLPIHTVVKFLPVISVALILIVMSLTDPAINVTSILLVFLLLYIFFASVLFELLHRYWHIVAGRGQAKLSHTRSYYIASIVAFVPVALIAMQSLQQLKVFDVMLVLVLVSLAVFYVVKRTAP